MIEGVLTMQAIKTVYDDIPELITIPKEFTHKKGEIIIIIEEDSVEGKNKIKEYYGCIPGFPERENQGRFTERDTL
jgi:hypothetical protein